MDIGRLQTCCDKVLRLRLQTVLYVDSHGAGSPQGNCLDLRNVKFAKGDDFKQIVQLPARIEYAVSGINCDNYWEYTITWRK